MVQNFSLGPGGPLQPQSGIVTNRFAPTTTGSQQLQDILRWLDAYKNRPNFVLGEAGDLLPKYSTGKNPLVPYQGNPNFQLGQGGPLRTPTNPKNIVPLLEDKLGKRVPPSSPEIDKIFSGGAKLDDLGKALKGGKNILPKLGPIASQALWAVPTAVTASKIPLELSRYFKSLGDYGGKSLETTGNKLDKEEARRIIKDFNSLYFGGDKDRGMTAPFIRAITEMGSGTKPSQNTLGAIDVKESRPKKLTKQEKVEAAKQIVEQYPFDTATGLPILPEEAIDWDTKGGGLTQPPTQSQAVGYAQPTQQTLQQPQQSGRTVDDIIALAQAQHQLRNEQMVPYIEALKEAMEKYGEGQNKNFFRDLGLAGLTGLTENQAYAKMIGGYDENKPVEKRLALQQQLTGLNQQQLFDPTQIYGNVELVQRLGLSPEAALANPDVLKQYANIYNYGLDYDAVLARLKQQEQQNALDRALKWEMHMNPQYNTLASQAQLGSSILANMQFSPALRESMTPEMIQYLISLTGFKPDGQPVVNQPQQPGVVPQQVPTRGNLNSLRNR